MLIYWYKCPQCGAKMFKYREDTKLENHIGFCKKCKKEMLINLL